MEENANKWGTFIAEGRITPESKLPGGKVLLEYDNAEVFVEGTISCVVGQAKSKKTFSMSLLLEQLLNPSEDGFVSNEPNAEVLWIDTEMSKKRVQLVSKRFSRPNFIRFYSVREYTIKQRYEFIEEAIKTLKPSIFVIDGFKELVGDINDQSYATRLLGEMLRWTSEYNVHLTGVLHTNPGSEKPRGALGTEMMNKASLVMDTTTSGSQTRLRPMYSRDKEFTPFVFTVDADGKPKFKGKIPEIH